MTTSVSQDRLYYV